jgi:hypothetical protein
MLIILYGSLASQTTAVSSLNSLFRRLSSFISYFLLSTVLLGPGTEIGFNAAYAGGTGGASGGTGSVSGGNLGSPGVIGWVEEGVAVVILIRLVLSLGQAGVGVLVVVVLEEREEELRRGVRVAEVEGMVMVGV